MSIRASLSVVLLLVVFNAKAQELNWLAHRIAVQEKNQHTVYPNHEQEKGFFNTHGLVLFYGSRCPHCQEFSPILKRFALERNAQVLPLSLDNQPLLEFPNFLPASTEWINAAFGGNAIHYPALFVINFNAKMLYPVGFGSMTSAELNDRMALLISKIKAYENKGGFS